MAEGLTTNRKKLIPFLFVLLSGHTITTWFTLDELTRNNGEEIFQIGDIGLEEYKRLQKILLENSLKLSEIFEHKYFGIYFELLWKKRAKNTIARNLFEANFSYE